MSQDQSVISVTPEIFYRTESGIPIAVDIAYDGKNGRWSGKTFDELSATVAGLARATMDGYDQLRQDALRLPVAEIDSHRYHEMLGVMPPLDHVVDEVGSSFKCVERYSGDITSIFACCGDRYFELRDLDYLTHTDIMGKVSDFMRSEHAARPAPRG